ncbi:hypothetical protein HNQ60_004907 [Povalibacter uvarum]|uniref:Uncharacterized protein n=1 Tax=Povalibacter uvarum TaxID=732238 RepID=A0A841HT12_9GAMM|nr:hypothetical protein [Povalibacter uvarum]MBB6096016.1 hypothetical protein [Povalibacter uvarum]
MKTRIAIGAALLLTLGTAVAGSMLYGQASAQAVVEAAPAMQGEATPEMIAMWKATATSTDYIAPRVPL